MKIVHFTPTFYPVIGGIESVVTNLASEMAALNYEVHVICLSRNSIISSSENEKIFENVGVSYFSYLDIFRPHRVARLVWLLRSANVLHLHDPKLALLVAISLVLAPKSKKYLTTHGGFFHHQRFILLKKIYSYTWGRFALGKFNLVFAISIADFFAFSKISPISNVRLSPNIVKMNPFNINPLSHPPGIRDWIYWGRVSKNKNLYALLEFIAFLKFNDVLITLHICSSYPLNKLKSFAKQQGLSSISFYQNIDETGIAKLITSSSVFILPSLYEGFGLTLVEAASSGLLPIYNNISPLNSIFPTEIGLALDFANFPKSLNDFLEYEHKVIPRQKSCVEDAIASSQVYSPRRCVDEILSAYCS